MAVRHGYGKIAGTDALVFAYDTGDTRNSFKGKPTTNFIAELGDPTEERARGEFGQYFNFVPIFETHGLVPYTLSMEIKGNIPGTCLVYMQNGSYTKYSFVSTWVNITTEWQRFVFPNLTPSGPTAAWQANTPNDHRAMLATYTIYGSGRNPTVRNVQLEHGAYATPFTTNTRSATQGLLDLTGNSTPDISNMSFNSNAELVFDGTDDGINVGNVSALSLSSGVGTVEAIVKLPRSWTAGSQYPNLISKGATAGWDTDGWALFGFRDWGGPKSWGFGIRNGATNRVTSRNNCPADVYLHIVATIDGSTIKLYENGSLYTTNTQTINPAANNTNVYIGRDASSQRFPGEIPIAKIYNRALTASEVQSNFLNYRKRFSDLANYYDNSTDGGRWIRFWWYTGVGWPGHETEALGHPFGTFDSNSHYGFQRLPEGLNKDDVELLAKDGSGNIYKWDFADGSETAQRVWDSMTQGIQGTWTNRGAWNPTVIAGSFFNTDQDTWQYRVSEGVASFLLDDDSCDCKSTLNAGHAMCGGSSWNQTYAQPDGAYLRYGVDTLNDGGCLGPTPERSLELFYRLK